MDPSLQVLLQGKRHSQELKAPAGETPLGKMLNEQLDMMADQLAAADDPATLKLISPALRRAQLREELAQELKMPELTSHLNVALKILLTEEHECLEAAAIQEIQDTFGKIAVLLDKRDVLDIQRLETAALKEVLGISDSCLESIAKIAIYKYTQEQYVDCTSLFALLTALNPENWDYWYRLGIAAQACDLKDLAVRAYQAASELNPDSCEPHIFAAECLLDLNEPAQAHTELSEAERAVASGGDECVTLIKALQAHLL